MQAAQHHKRVALVTGGSKGIGFAMAQALARRGISTIVLVARTEADLAEAKRALEGQGAKHVETMSADLTKTASIQAIHDFLKQRYGKLDILINNAGDFKQLPAQGREDAGAVSEDVAKLFAVNAVPPAAMAHALQPLLLASGHPLQLDVLSSAALEVFPGNNPYGPTKVAHERVSLSTVADSNGCICTYRVYPSNTDTRIVKHFDVPKLTPQMVADEAVEMMLEDSGTDLYLKMTEEGMKKAVFRLDYSKYLRETESGDIIVDGLGLVSEHRALIRAFFEPVVREGKR